MSDPLAQLLAPLANVTPVTRADRRSERSFRRPAKALALAVVAIGSAATYKAYETTRDTIAPATQVRLTPAMSCLVGGSARTAATTLRRHGYAVRWQLLTYKTPRLAESTNPGSVAADGVVESVWPTGHTVLLVVHAADDPNAPPVVSSPGCG